MSIEILEIEPSDLDEYARVPIAFTVESVLQVKLIDQGLGGFLLQESPVPPYVKDYDRAEGSIDHPTRWPERFDLSNWGLFLARSDGRPVGGGAVAFDTPGLNMLEGRGDLAVLWDIRVHPDWRGRGLGTRLFQTAAQWSRQKGCRQLKAETQNINVKACQFYARQGCSLGAIHRYAYVSSPEVAHEAILLWYLDL